MSAARRMRMRPLRHRRAPTCRACSRRGHIASNRLCPRNARAFPPKPVPMPADADKPIEGAVAVTVAERADLRALESARARGQA